MFNWIKNHKLLLILVLIIAYLLRNSIFPTPLSLKPQSSYSLSEPSANMGAVDLAGRTFAPQVGITTSSDYQKVSTSTERVVVQESSLSLLVKNVRETGNKIIDYAKNSGGYMVSSSYNNPSEQAFATVTVRVPTNKLDSALNQFRNFAIKVTNENLLGTDVTQEYQDLDQRIKTLTETKTKFEEILKKATTVDEILRVNQEIINIETQIDQATDQKLAISDNAKLTKITLYLSTDELALPYTPDKTFRPDVVFKLAVRSLLSTLQNLAELLIWLAVFAVIWIPALAIIMGVRKKLKSKNRTGGGF